MKILALDQSMKMTGWASVSDGLYESGRVHFQEKNERHKEKHFADFWQWLNDALSLHEPTLVVYEMPVSQGQGSNAIPLMGLRALIVTACALQKIECVGVWPNTLKKFATGDGKAEKVVMKEAAKAVFDYYIPSEDPGGDEADALLLLRYGEMRPDLDLQPQKPKRKRKKAKATPEPAPGGEEAGL